MKRTLLALLTLSAVSSSAAPVVFHSLAEVSKASFYRLTCSDDVAPTQAHVHLSVYKGKVEGVKIYGITPAESVDVIEFTQEEVKWFDYKIDAQEFRLEGVISEYFDEEFSLVVVESGGAFIGRLRYDNHDGQAFERTLKCGAVNYLKVL